MFVISDKVYRSSIGQFFLRSSTTSGEPDISFSLKVSGDVGIAGDWNGDGTDTTGVFRPSNGGFYLRNSNTNGYAEINLALGIDGDMPIAGDWDGIP